MQVRTGQDFAAGVMFALIGIGALYIGADYPMGTPQRPGTGVLPRILAWCLVGSGGILIIKALVSGDQRVGAWAWRPLLCVTLAVIAFAMVAVFLTGYGFGVYTQTLASDQLIRQEGLR